MSKYKLVQVYKKLTQHYVLTFKINTYYLLNLFHIKFKNNLVLAKINYKN